MNKHPQKTSENASQGTAFGLPKKREKVVELLGQAYANNDLEVEEYERRLDLAHSAKSLEVLQQAIHDFPQVHTIFPPRAAPQRPAPNPSPLAEDGDAVRVVQIIGDAKINSVDVTNPFLKVIQGIGDSHIDLRKVDPAIEHITIESYSGIGDLKIKLPANSEVRRNLYTLIGEVRQRVIGSSFFKKLFKKKAEASEVPPPSRAPLFVDLKGFKLIGDVVIEFEQSRPDPGP